MVIISGTGTMGQVLTSDGKTFNCGGWGHMFGDGMLCTEIFSILLYILSILIYLTFFLLFVSM
jgi:hypothetical protein